MSWQLHTLRRALYLIDKLPTLSHITSMRWLFSSLLVLVWTAIVAARSFSGNRLLVVLEEQSEREKYSVFLGDLTGELRFRRKREVAESGNGTGWKLWWRN
jgi:hypothetical protein